VLRLVPGDSLILFDGSGWEFLSTIREVNRNFVGLTIHQRRRGRRGPPLDILLGVGLLAGQKMDLVVQKAVELGVREICPLVTGRTVKALDPQRARERVKRWERISREASRQCGRSEVAGIRPLLSFDQMMTVAASVELRILFSEKALRPLRSLSRDFGATPRQILLLSGPEGGFSAEEEARAVNSGFVAVSLGPRVLRAETAAILAVGLVQFEFGDLGRTREVESGDSRTRRGAPGGQLP
jgi:16S rRNA (uracil1498-N3)-methyltransferase